MKTSLLLKGLGMAIAGAAASAAIQFGADHLPLIAPAIAALPVWARPIVYIGLPIAAAWFKKQPAELAQPKPEAPTPQ